MATAESLVAVTQGSGKNLHTVSRSVGGQTVEDEVVLLGEPWYPEYRVAQGTTYASWATDTSHLFQLMAGASLNVIVRRIRVYQHAAATTAALFTLQVVRLTTAGTGGTSFTGVAVDSTDPATGAACMTLPTVKGTEGTVLDQCEAYAIQTVGASQSGDSLPLAADLDYRGPRQKGIRIAAGTANGIAVKMRGGVAGANGHTVIDYIEIPSF